MEAGKARTEKVETSQLREKSAINYGLSQLPYHGTPYCTRLHKNTTLNSQGQGGRADYTIRSLRPGGPLYMGQFDMAKKGYLP